MPCLCRFQRFHYLQMCMGREQLIPSRLDTSIDPVTAHGLIHVMPYLSYQLMNSQPSKSYIDQEHPRIHCSLVHFHQRVQDR